MTAADTSLSSGVDPSVLAVPVARFHQSLQEPLLAALEAHGESQPMLVADIIDSMVVRVSRDAWDSGSETTADTPTGALDLLRRLLGPYLGQDRSSSSTPRLAGASATTRGVGSDVGRPQRRHRTHDRRDRAGCRLRTLSR